MNHQAHQLHCKWHSTVAERETRFWKGKGKGPDFSRRDFSRMACWWCILWLLTTWFGSLVEHLFFRFCFIHFNPGGCMHDLDALEEGGDQIKRSKQLKRKSPWAQGCWFSVFCHDVVFDVNLFFSLPDNIKHLYDNKRSLEQQWYSPLPLGDANVS